jgi:aldehyde dehydrogenase (NAD+)
VVGALSGGNCVVITPSAYAPATSAVIAELIAAEFDPGHVAVVEGGRQANQALLEQHFDHIFFTGSVEVGKLVMASAARHLTPVTLELGGKSPVIVTADANLKLAARRVAFGKVLNAGQTCVAPDYLLIESGVKDAFLAEFRRALESFFPGGDHTDFPMIVSEKHFQRVSGLLESGTPVIGGGTDPNRRFIEPTVLVDVSADSPVMQEEIFGPILPVLEYTELSEAIDFVRSRPRPLALYLFTASREVEQRVLDTCSFGGGCVNDTVIHLANPRLPFGGVGHSGMGSYHGRASFNAFTHQRSIVKTATWLDLPFRYHPYTGAAQKVIRRLLG